MRIAFFDLVRVLDECKQGKAGADELRRQFDAQQKELLPLVAQAEKSAGKSGGSKGFAKKQIEERIKEHDADRERLRASLRAELLRRVEPLVARLASDGGFDAVVTRNAAIYFVKPEIDLTAKLLAALDS